MCPTVVMTSGDLMTITIHPELVAVIGHCTTLKFEER